MRLTPDLIEEACQFVNPLKERELDLRAKKIQVIENLACTSDQVHFWKMKTISGIRYFLRGFINFVRIQCQLYSRSAAFYAILPSTSIENFL